MDILIAVAAKIAEYTIAPIGRQVGYLIFYKAKFKELRDRVSDLEYKRDEIKQRVEEERRNGKTTFDVVQNWLKNVDDAIGEATQLQNDPRRAEAGCSRWSFPNVVTHHQLSRKATKVAQKVVQVRGGGDFSQVAYRPKLDAVSAFTTRSSQNLEPRKPIMENIMHALRDPKVSMVGVYGLGGVGKTTLVEEVYHIAKENQLFDEVVMATISKTPDIKTVQEEIADQLGLRFEEVTVAGRAPRLYQRIKKEKTILLILDDIWEALDLKKVGIPSDGEHNGCKLLMTSRTLDLLRQMGVKEHFRLEVLNEEESWSLFQSKANNLDKELDKHQIAFQLAKRCAGLPILIVTMARSLIDQNIHAWKDALSQLEKVDNEELQEITYSALELSYKRLKDNEMKAFFLLCATIGKDPSVNYLFKYGIGLGIFNSTNIMEGARNRLHNMISALKASCLLLVDNTSTTRVKMHDVVREVAISIAYKDYHILAKYGDGDNLREFPKMDILSNCSQIILRYGAFRQLPEKLDAHNLKIFYLSNFDLSLEIPNFFFAETKFLEVLDLTGLNLTSLPTSFLSLTNLKTLCLDQCVLENIDAVGALKNLKILSLWGSSMIKLSSEIGKLSHLRMLDLSDSGIEIIPAGVISSLIKLEELYMGNTSIKWKIENSDNQDENASLDELRQLSNLTSLELQIQEAWMLPRDLMFHKLERFKIVIGDVWEWADIDDVTLKTLKLKLGTNIHLEHGIKGLMRRAENLYLDEVEGISNVLYQLNGDGFPQLKHLHIQNNALIQHIIDFIERSHIPTPFPNLEKLVIQNLGKMEKICHGPLAVGFFAKLLAIKVEKCNKVKYLLFVSMVKGMPQLAELEISKCNLMEKVVFEDDDASAMNDETGETIQFPLLHSLTLQHLDALECFYSHPPTSSPISLFNNQAKC
ncbi:disease resistance protein At4g27190-like [Arachis stenosperma]|uniref:disease resistance protein At4g27190-like n=1 Tax=Arachis stenosperma TaxID=217475 RepID=UPI0025AD4262|nr:disease resistance protein At4g27190-like [Arachis stenosperma]